MLNIQADGTGSDDPALAKKYDALLKTPHTWERSTEDNIRLARHWLADAQRWAGDGWLWELQRVSSQTWVGVCTHTTAPCAPTTQAAQGGALRHPQLARCGALHGARPQRQHDGQAEHL